jgi:hypothetical protein
MVGCREEKKTATLESDVGIFYSVFFKSIRVSISIELTVWVVWFLKFK